MKRAILRLLTREYDEGIVARDIIKQHHEPGQIRVKVKVRNRIGRRLAEACAIVKLEEVRQEEIRYLEHQASLLTVEVIECGLFSVKNPESGSHYQVRQIVDDGEVIWDCNCLHFQKMGRRDCKHAKAAEMTHARSLQS